MVEDGSHVEEAHGREALKFAHDTTVDTLLCFFRVL